MSRQRLTDEKISQLDVVPEIFPDFFLRGPWDMYEVAANLDVRPVDNGQFGPNFADERNKTGHLGIIFAKQASD